MIFPLRVLSVHPVASRVLRSCAGCRKIPPEMAVTPLWPRKLCFSCDPGPSDPAEQDSAVRLSSGYGKALDWNTHLKLQVALGLVQNLSCNGLVAWLCLSYFSTVVIKRHDQGNLQRHLFGLPELEGKSPSWQGSREVGSRHGGCSRS